MSAPGEGVTPEEELPASGAEFDYETYWKEVIDTTQPGGGDHTTNKEQEAVLVGYVPFDQVVAAEKWFLGYSWCDGGSPYRLHRRPPCRHPRKPHLFACSFSSVGIGPKSNPDNPNKETYRLSDYPDPDGASLYYADYEYAICTVRFRSFGRTFFLDDTYMPEADDWYKYEWQRFSEVTLGPQTQSLQADGSSNLVFREGSGVNGKAFPAPLAELMAKANVKVRWLGVPHNYLTTNLYYLKPDKILGCLGKVSNALHIGFDAGTMLLLAAEFDPCLFPVVSDNPDIPVTGWDVTLSYEQFDPDKGVADSPPGTSVYRGHRLFPYRVDGKWYYATREDASKELLPSADLNNVFKHVSAA